MEIELIPKPAYAVRVNGREVAELREVSEWEGLRKLVDANGQCLIVGDIDGPMTAALHESCGAIFGTHRRCYVVSGSPDLLHAIKVGAGETATEGHNDRVERHGAASGDRSAAPQGSASEPHHED